MNFKFKKDIEKPIIDDFWYDLTNGYYDLNELLEDKEQIEKLNDAIDLIQKFEYALEDIGEEC